MKTLVQFFDCFALWNCIDCYYDNSKLYDKRKCLFATVPKQITQLYLKIFFLAEILTSKASYILLWMDFCKELFIHFY